MFISFPHERTTASAGVWSTIAVTSREPTWLQNGEMDRAKRIQAAHVLHRKLLELSCEGQGVHER